MEAFLLAALPKILSADRSFSIHPFQGKSDMMMKLESRLHAYQKWLPEDWRIVVVVDRDDDDCHVLKQQMESAARSAGLRTRTSTKSTQWQLVNRIAIEELEAWYFGDWTAVQMAYPRVSKSVPGKRQYRDADAIAGGTWEAFERVMKQYGYYQSGLAKIEAARNIGAHIDPQRSQSPSFQVFRDALL